MIKVIKSDRLSAWHCPNVCKHSHSPLVCDKTENLNFSKTKFSFCWLASLSVRDGFIRVDVCKHRSVVLMMAGISDLSKFKNRTEPRVKRQLMLKWLIHWFILLYWTWEATLQRKRIFIFWVYSSSVVGSVRASSGSDNLYWKAKGDHWHRLTTLRTTRHCCNPNKFWLWNIKTFIFKSDVKSQLSVRAFGGGGSQFAMTSQLETTGWDLTLADLIFLSLTELTNNFFFTGNLFDWLWPIK